MADKPQPLPPIRTYKVFHVAQDNTIIPQGSSRFGASLTGKRVVDLVDVNRNGIPDSGDTAITNMGARIEDMRLDRSITRSSVSGDAYDEVSDAWITNHLLKGRGTNFNVTAVPTTGIRSACIQLAGSLQNYGGKHIDGTRRIASSISDHPSVVAAATVVIGGMMLHPASRAVLSVASEIVSQVGAVAGTGYILGDRILGIAQGTEMGKYDLEGGLGILGGTGPLRITHEEFLGETAHLIVWAIGKIRSSGGGGLLLPQVAGSGMAGGLAVPAVTKAAVAAAGAPSGASLSELLMTTATPMMVSSLGGPPKQAVFSASARPQNILWDGTPAAKAAEGVRMEIERSGDAQALKAFDNLMEVTKRIYRSSTNANVRSNIALALSDLENETIALIENSQGLPASPRELVAASTKTLQRIIRETNEIIPDFVALQPAREALQIPKGVVLDEGLEVRVAKDGLTDILKRAIENFARGTGDIKPLNGKEFVKGSPQIYEMRFGQHSGPRVYFFKRNGQDIIIKVGLKDGQLTDVRSVAQRALEIFRG